MIKGIELRGFMGGVILRGEGHSKQLTGKIDLLKSETEMRSMISKPEHSLLKEFADADSVKISDNLHSGAMLIWNEPNFSQYSFDLVALINGTFQVGRLSSFNGFGTTEWAEARKKYKLRSIIFEGSFCGMQYLELPEISPWIRTLYISKFISKNTFKVYFYVTQM